MIIIIGVNSDQSCCEMMDSQVGATKSLDDMIDDAQNLLDRLAKDEEAANEMLIKTHVLNNTMIEMKEVRWFIGIAS